MAAPNSSRPLALPLRFERICLEKVWGGRKLERTPGFALPGSGPIGETWELVDRDDHNSIVAEGTLRGATLRDLVRDQGRSMLGRAKPARSGRFPLLVKFLDASEPLSVQVHPKSGSIDGGHEGKDEAWYVLDAAPESRLWLGMRPGVHRRQLAESAAKREVLAHLLEWPVRAGDWAMVPGGTVHSIGGGICLFEVQENSDTTHRLYDWDRPGLDGKPRPMQIEDALAVTQYGESAPGPRTARFQSKNGVRRAQLASCASFAMELYDIEHSIELDTDDLPRIAVALVGRATLRTSAGASVELCTGDTWLLPASLGKYSIQARDGRLSLMYVTAAA